MLDMIDFQKTCKMFAQRMRNRCNSAVFLGDHHILGSTIFGDAIIIDSRDLKSLKNFYLPPPSDTAIFSFLYHFIHPGMKCADIGAGSGYLSLVLSVLVGTKGSVLSVEENIEHYELLRRNVQANEYSGIVELKKTIDFDGAKLDFIHISSDRELPQILTSLKEIVNVSPSLLILCHINPKYLVENETAFDDFFSFLDVHNFEGFIFPTLSALESKEQLLQSSYAKSILLCCGPLKPVERTHEHH